MITLVVAVGLAALGGSFVGALCGLFLGSQIMVKTVKEAFRE